MRAIILPLLLLLPSLAVAENIDTQSCYVDGLSEKLECGSVSVPLDYQNPDEQQIDIHYLILPAIKPQAGQPPLLAISGGPGQSAIDSARLFNQVFSRVRQTRDILLIDQRGTGRSAHMGCSDSTLAQALAIDDRKQDLVLETQKCFEQLPYPTQFFDTESGVRDFEKVRLALGYPSVHLYGISYGTRVAQVYLTLFPQSVLTTTLDGVVPMQQSVIAIGHSIERGFNLVMQDCQENLDCNRQYPNLAGQFKALKAQLAKKPATLKVADPLTAEPRSLILTQAKLLGALRIGMYSPSTRALIPYVIDQAAQGNYNPITGFISMTFGAGELAMGMHTAVICGEDYPRLDDALKASMSDSYIASEMIKMFDVACPMWDMPKADPQYSNAVATDKPVLLLSGELDPATPPSWGEMAKERLTNGRHIISPYASHGVAMQTCAGRIIADFIETQSHSGLDTECMDNDTRRSFYLNANSTEPNSTKEEQ
ncbi:alpha/beta hydrolase [Paraferrimonas haliotis]|uniref:Transporter n=1 Tax=Paraferrimonas haliotis TaxID=2013866 RepID=A0AA37TUZ1_9GAMM|nr:alpha/beta hydrolase [Paraferrimonas haliotis]GLS85017.1 transporter [Paraferrimonas haliotis]